MKKLIIVVAIATPLFFSCEIEKTPMQKDAGLSFNASIEQLKTTKATINASYQFLWAESDKIGIYVNDGGWGTKNQPFTLVGEGGSSSGAFNWDHGTFENTNANAAFFPWHGQNSSTDNNVSESTMYYKLAGSYGGDADKDTNPYTSGKMLTPLVAPVSYSAGEYLPIAFKHAGAAVKVSFTNLPAGAHSMGMTATGQQIYGDYHIAVADAGTANLTLDAAEDPEKNSIWLNFTPGNSPRAFTFIFPVPFLADDSDLSFQMWDENNIKVWEATASDQPAINHGNVLEFPELTITPYRQFNAVDAHWTVIGSHNGWAGDTPMVTDGTLCIAKGISFAADGGFKVRYDGKYYGEGGDSYPRDGNWNIYEGAGEYDIIFNTSTKVLTAVKSKCPYPAASGFGKGENLHTAQDLTDGGTKDFSTYFE